MDDSFQVTVGYRCYRYSEADGRSLELERDPGVDVPAIIYVPSSAAWVRKMPQWASDHREVILDRIRQATAHMNAEWQDVG